ncbi:MAG TPA: ABC transporter permease [Ktedonobacterales bacterium]|jgi:peptide/nickel transport system permease protein|nr:ABC transporter permease [Ktedonobacterales bacterium]
MRQLIRRVGFYLVALWASATVNFLIPRLTPGNPAQALLARHARAGGISPAALHALEVQYGVTNEPLYAQYGQYLNNLLHANLGTSFANSEPVTNVIARDLPWTLVLVGVALILSFVIGTILGVCVAWWRGSKLDTLLMPAFTFIAALPYFWFALALVFILGYTLNWFPPNGGYDIYTYSPGPSLGFLLSAARYAILPAFTIIIGSIAGWMLGMRNMMITTLSEDYVLMAEAKGLPQHRIMLTYAARNAILPNITGFALSLGFVVSGSLLTEIVFNYPGIGYALVQGVENKDYPVIQGLFLIITVAVLVANFLADLVYVILDPRVRGEKG